MKNKSFIINSFLLLGTSIVVYFYFDINGLSKIVNLFVVPFIYFVGRWEFIKMYQRSLENFKFGSSKRAFKNGLWIARISLYITQFSFLYAAIVAVGTGGLTTTPLGLYLVYGLFSFWLIGFGNYIQKVEPNFVFGIHLPWVMKSEKNWQIAHRFVSKIMLTLGLILLISMFFIRSIEAHLGNEGAMLLPVLILLLPVALVMIKSKICHDS